MDKYYEKNTNNVTISAQIPKELADLLEKICKETERSRSYVIRKALEKFIKDKK